MGPLGRETAMDNEEVKPILSEKAAGRLLAGVMIYYTVFFVWFTIRVFV